MGVDVEVAAAVADAVMPVVDIARAVEVTAPDGSLVRILAACQRGSMAQFSLAPHAVSVAVRHRSVQELWYFTRGSGRMWRRCDGGAGEIVPVGAGMSLAIAQGTSFQFRCDGDEALEAIGVTMPPWPGADEAEFVPGVW